MEVNSGVVSINFKKKDEPKSSLVQFSTVLEGVDFVQKTDLNSIEYISLTDGFGYQVVGAQKIKKVYENNSGLYQGSNQCLHPYTDCASGGGVKCPTCKAWFCY